jgi:hypothetical protein
MEVLEALSAPVLHHVGINLLGLRPIQVFFDVVEPYSLVLLLSGHALQAIIYRNTLLRNFIDFLTGDAAGAKVKTLASRSLETLLPGRVFTRLSSMYTSYYLFLQRYRP